MYVVANKYKIYDELGLIPQGLIQKGIQLRSKDVFKYFVKVKGYATKINHEVKKINVGGILVSKC